MFGFGRKPNKKEDEFIGKAGAEQRPDGLGRSVALSSKVGALEGPGSTNDSVGSAAAQRSLDELKSQFGTLGTPKNGGLSFAEPPKRKISHPSSKDAAEEHVDADKLLAEKMRKARAPTDAPAEMRSQSLSLSVAGKKPPMFLVGHAGSGLGGGHQHGGESKVPDMKTLAADLAARRAKKQGTDKKRQLLERLEKCEKMASEANDIAKEVNAFITFKVKLVGTIDEREPSADARQNARQDASHNRMSMAHIRTSVSVKGGFGSKKRGGMASGMSAADSVAHRKLIEGTISQAEYLAITKMNKMMEADLDGDGGGSGGGGGHNSGWADSDSDQEDEVVNAEMEAVLEAAVSTERMAVVVQCSCSVPRHEVLRSTGRVLGWGSGPATIMTSSKWPPFGALHAHFKPPARCLPQPGSGAAGKPVPGGAGGASASGAAAEPAAEGAAKKKRGVVFKAEVTVVVEEKSEDLDKSSHHGGGGSGGGGGGGGGGGSGGGGGGAEDEDAPVLAGWQSRVSSVEISDRPSELGRRGSVQGALVGLPPGVALEQAQRNLMESLGEAMKAITGAKGVEKELAALVVHCANQPPHLGRQVESLREILAKDIATLEGLRAGCREVGMRLRRLTPEQKEAAGKAIVKRDRRPNPTQSLSSEAEELTLRAAVSAPRPGGMAGGMGDFRGSVAFRPSHSSGGSAGSRGSVSFAPAPSAAAASAAPARSSVAFEDSPVSAASSNSSRSSYGGGGGAAAALDEATAAEAAAAAAAAAADMSELVLFEADPDAMADVLRSLNRFRFNVRRVVKKGTAASAAAAAAAAEASAAVARAASAARFAAGKEAEREKAEAAELAGLLQQHALAPGDQARLKELSAKAGSSSRTRTSLAIAATEAAAAAAVAAHSQATRRASTAALAAQAAQNRYGGGGGDDDDDDAEDDDLGAASHGGGGGGGRSGRGSVDAPGLPPDFSYSGSGWRSTSNDADVTTSLRLLFRAVDTDGSGEIDADELQAAMSELGLVDSFEGSGSSSRTLFEAFDKDQSGSLEFDEFERLIRNRLHRNAIQPFVTHEAAYSALLRHLGIDLPNELPEKVAVTAGGSAGEPGYEESLLLPTAVSGDGDDFSSVVVRRRTSLIVLPPPPGAGEALYVNGPDGGDLGPGGLLRNVSSPPFTAATALRVQGSAVLRRVPPSAHATPAAAALMPPPLGGTLGALAAVPGGVAALGSAAARGSSTAVAKAKRRASLVLAGVAVAPEDDGRASALVGQFDALAAFPEAAAAAAAKERLRFEAASAIPPLGRSLDAPPQRPFHASAPRGSQEMGPGVGQGVGLRTEPPLTPPRPDSGDYSGRTAAGGGGGSGGGGGGDGGGGGMVSDPGAMVRLGRKALRQRRFSQALSWFHKAAVLGDVGAMVEVARLHDKGLGLEVTSARNTRDNLRLLLLLPLLLLNLLLRDDGGWGWMKGTG